MEPNIGGQITNKLQKHASQALHQTLQTQKYTLKNLLG